MLTTQAVKDEARHLGFALAGVTTPETPPHMSAYENWLRLGRHASMEYLAGERARTCRRDPRLILPECRSILVLGVRYPDPKTAKPDRIGWPHRTRCRLCLGPGLSSRFTTKIKGTGCIYRARSGQAGSRTAGIPIPVPSWNATWRSAPVWVGSVKTPVSSTQKLGSYFLLAEILLGIDLEPDPPFTADRCGTCTRCIEACPTHCILPDRTLDARRCIAYLTIENKGEIPSDLRAAHGQLDLRLRCVPDGLPLEPVCGKRIRPKSSRHIPTCQTRI